jgi:hypothetical protein
MEYFKRLLGMALIAGSASVGLVACGDDDSATSAGAGGSGAGSNTGGGSTSTGTDGVCILHNCSAQEHCAGCAEGRVNCRIEAGEESGRCVACGSDGTGCPEGQECSSYGDCVPIGLECPTDNEGTPQITCANSGDCAACDPAHRICDGGECVGCTDNDTSACQTTDICKDGKCASACATDCTVDNDCSKCTGAKACNKHRCTECSKTYACPSGEKCDLNTGTCEKICGRADAPGSCETDADCAGCETAMSDANWKCFLPINGGVGQCGVDAAGCEDLGDGALTLPAPYNQITNTCSNDVNCQNVGITYNVGEALRDLLGSDEVVGQPIGDANINYPMDVCAAVTVAGNSCGVCVPCRDDSDCMDIDLDSLSSELFPGVGGALVALAFDAIFGPNDHKLYMYCESVAAGYGVCLPCPGLLNDCTPESGGGGGGSGTCDHDVTEAGSALDPTCDDCAAQICQTDSFCCEVEWDSLCVDAAATECNVSNCHDVCATGTPMGASCGTCEGEVCSEDPYCCDTAWDSTCVALAESSCGVTCN